MKPAELGISDMPVRPAAVPPAGTASAGGMAAVRQGRAFGEVAKLRGAKLLAEAEAEIWNHPRRSTGWRSAASRKRSSGRTASAIWLARTASPDGSGRVPSSGFRRSRKNGKDQTWLFILAAS